MELFVRCFLAFTIGLFLAVMILVSVGRAQEAQEEQCQPVAAIVEVINSVKPIVASVDLEADQAARVMNWLVTEGDFDPAAKKWTQVTLMKHADGIGFMAGHDGLVCAAAMFNPQSIPKLLSVIAGDQANGSSQ